VNQVRDFRRAFGGEQEDRILQLAVGFGDAFILAQVLQPGLPVIAIGRAPPRQAGFYES
jgi:hypothetical protein